MLGGFGKLKLPKVTVVLVESCGVSVGSCAFAKAKTKKEKRKTKALRLLLLYLKSYNCLSACFISCSVVASG